MKGILKKILPAKTRKGIRKFEAKLKTAFSPKHPFFKSYAQEGEDMVLRNYFENKVNGFYIDIGAHHPSRFSNTYYFYRLGWRGINIDAMPGSMDAFKKLRPYDINIEAAISDVRESIPFYIFEEKAFNTFNQQLGEQYKTQGYSKLIEKRIIETVRLDDILKQYAVSAIDFISIDVEGFEMQVLNALNWEKHSPKAILIEDLAFNFNSFNQSELHTFLTAKNFKLYGRTGNTLIYVS